KRIPEYLSLAFNQATSGRPGPVFLELPPDILFIQTDEENVALPPKRDHKTAFCPDALAISEAVNLIDSAKQPLFIGGSGVGFSDCKKELEAFIEKTGMPF
ncbi:MAG: thiamine pyrophosphate-binding protein, partial [Desulfomonilaceae bacterium]